MEKVSVLESVSKVYEVVGKEHRLSLKRTTSNLGEEWDNRIIGGSNSTEPSSTCVWFLGLTYTTEVFTESLPNPPPSTGMSV